MKLSRPRKTSPVQGQVTLASGAAYSAASAAMASAMRSMSASASAVK
jgi:hypothetical protein